MNLPFLFRWRLFVNDNAFIAFLNYLIAFGVLVASHAGWTAYLIVPIILLQYLLTGMVHLQDENLNNVLLYADLQEHSFVLP